ncbi:hypothetical protein [Kitasatospora sp. HPMI-4]|uniref:hypothetical protein n=1 Tax=Kitasatospora sp. HPMI-4 TaxID=3448443 RepID=UPI003F1C7724
MQLMADVRTAGVSVSAAQLERWRAKGLLPRATRAWRGRYGTHSLLPEGSVELATALGRRSRRGQDWSELTVLVWLDGAPVKDSLLTGALRRVARHLFETVLRQVQREMERHPVPEGWSLGPDYDIAEAVARLIMQGAGSAPINRELRARLRAAGYQDIPQAPLIDLLIKAITGEDPDEEMVQEWLVALGLNGADPESEEARRAGLGLLVGAGVQELTGQRGLGAVGQHWVDFMNGDLAVTAEELHTARRDLVWLLDAMGIAPADRQHPAEHPMVGQTVGFYSLLWALIRRLLPEGYGVRDVALAGLGSLKERAQREGPAPLVLAG